MAVSDPIADMLTRIRNSLLAERSTVSMPGSKLKVAIAEILRDEGFIEDFVLATDDKKPHPVLRIGLKYVGERRERRPVISGLERVSKPGRRIYVGKDEIPWIQSGLGMAILSTPKGVMADRRARQLGVGGEVLCKIW
jgi:small subunit ribosomal protein S8